jgi:hypothetical protein
MGTSFVRAPAVLAESLATLQAAYPDLPAQYLKFLQESNGAEGDLGIEPGWFVVWSAEGALTATKDYGLPVCLPGYFTFGSNGGGELFVFELQAGAADRTVFMVPAIGMAVSELLVVARSFAEFQVHMGKVLRNEA